MSESEDAININDERAVRRARRAALIEAGVNPYPIHSHVDAYAAEPPSTRDSRRGRTPTTS